ncbi:hypothetical protein GW17_00004509 [Ensete ventricosum]|nr:hypothetical protein GW17_00004509 [Ensete ventricosum]RZR79998.1 hypothetical protein BHM03_00005891 [Ensete ventricosum]
MKRFRGFKLGRRVVGVWRWVVRRRCRPKHYLRLNTPSKSNLSTTMTTKIIDWGRHLAGCLRRGPHCRIGGRSSADDRKLSAGAPLIDREGEGRRGWTTPPPKGHLAVYVGGEKEGGAPRRYTVPVIYFNHPLFGELLREAEEEFGFHHPGGITIPCPAAKFERVRSRIAAAGSERLHCKRASSLLS